MAQKRIDKMKEAGIRCELTGYNGGYIRLLGYLSLIHISTFANHGEVEIVRRAVDFISAYNARVRKPVITPRNKFFQ